jgi:short-subunit dehydrogenase
MATVLILGATSDIGRAIAKRFAKEGYDLQLAARKTDRLSPLQSDIKIRFNRECSLHEFDAAKTETHLSFWDNLFPKPDIAIVVFGFMDEIENTKSDSAVLLNTINVNYTGAVSVLNIISRHYKSSGQGQIVGISSVAGERGRASNYIYGSAKAGFTAYLSGLRNELFSAGVHVTTVLPGFVYTRMTENINLPGLLTASPEEVAASVYRATAKKKNVVYIKWFWRWIMLVIKLIPENIFKKMHL